MWHILLILFSTHLYSQVRVDKFKIDFKVIDNRFLIKIDTDLPLDTDISVTIDRGYFETGNKSKYAVSYFEETSNLINWKTIREIVVDDSEWEKSLINKQEEMSRLGLGFKVKNIESIIEVRAIIPIHQKNPLFGKFNSNLSGKVVKKNSVGKFVEQSIKIKRPIGLRSKDRGKSYDPSNLDLNERYFCSRKTPLMPKIESDDLDDLKRVVIIPIGGSFRVKKRTQNGNTTWYFVEHVETKMLGWLNSAALIGQKLK